MRTETTTLHCAGRLAKLLSRESAFDIRLYCTHVFRRRQICSLKEQTAQHCRFSNPYFQFDKITSLNVGVIVTSPMRHRFDTSHAAVLQISTDRLGRCSSLKEQTKSQISNSKILGDS